MKDLPHVEADTARAYDFEYQTRAETLLSVDEQIEVVVQVRLQGRQQGWGGGPRGGGAGALCGVWVMAAGWASGQHGQHSPSTHHRTAAPLLQALDDIGQLDNTYM